MTEEISSSAEPLITEGDNIYTIEYVPSSYEFHLEDFQLLQNEYDNIMRKSNQMFTEIQNFLQRRGYKESPYMNHLLREKREFEERLADTTVDDSVDWFVLRSKVNGFAWDLVLLWGIWGARVQDIYTMQRKAALKEPFLPIKEVNMDELRRCYNPRGISDVKGYTELEFPNSIKHIREEKSKIYFPIGPNPPSVFCFYDDRPPSLIAAALAVLSRYANGSYVEEVSWLSHVGPWSKKKVAEGKNCPKVVFGNFKVQSFFENIFSTFRLDSGITKSNFVTSLSECKEWVTDGGKSNSIFFMTQDKRFIIKSIHPIEFNSFLGIVRGYIDHMNSYSRDSRTPLILAKIFGVYKISNSRTKDCVIVMENVFSRKGVDITYDVKGTTYRRKKREPELFGGVRLDQNLKDDLERSELIFDDASKKTLERALERELQFLMSNKIMDYSLLLGFGVADKVVTCGVIDFLRPYTCDKKLESAIKSFTRCNTPTIVSPPAYKTRLLQFVKAAIRTRPTTPPSDSH